MADSNYFDILSSSEQMQANYVKYKDKFKDATAELVNSETFMKLLVAEMTNQDPLEPTSNTEFISQLATFSQMQYAQDSSRYAMANYAANLVGKTATASKMEGKNLVTKTGIVESVVRNADNSSYTVKIDGETFDLSKITQVLETAKNEPVKEETPASDPAGTINSANALGDSISRAAMMVGMYATVSGKATDGSNYLDAGFISAIQVKDGVISAIINNVSHPLSDIIEVTYATVDETEPSQNEAMEAAMKTEDDKIPEQTFLTDDTDIEIDENAVLQTGAITPEKQEENVADLVDDDEEEQIRAVEAVDG